MTFNISHHIRRRQDLFIRDLRHLDVLSWLREGAILQTEDFILLGEGPFISSERPGRGFFCPDFFLKMQKPWLYPKKIYVVNRTELESWFNRTVVAGGIRQERGLQSCSNPPSFTEFHRVFADFQQRMKRGELKKAVPVFFEKVKGTIPVSLLLQTLLNTTSRIRSEGFLYGIWGQGFGLLGFTPEKLFSFSGKRLSLMALAGTAPCPGPSLLRDEKELREHDLVVQGLRESFTNTSWKTSSVTEKKFGSLKHLCLNMEGTLREPADFSLLCRRLHPTPALGGFPKQTALQWLKTHPGQKNRGHFGAPFGFFDGKGNGFCLIALRGLEWNFQDLKWGAGCGLVEGSALQKEWRELFLKRRQIRSFFNFPSDYTDPV